MQNQCYVNYKLVCDTAEYSETTAPINTYVLTIHNPISDVSIFSISIDRDQIVQIKLSFDFIVLNKAPCIFLQLYLNYNITNE